MSPAFASHRPERNIAVNSAKTPVRVRPRLLAIVVTPPAQADARGCRTVRAIYVFGLSLGDRNGGHIIFPNDTKFAVPVS